MSFFVFCLVNNMYKNAMAKVYTHTSVLRRSDPIFTTASFHEIQNMCKQLPRKPEMWIVVVRWLKLDPYSEVILTCCCFIEKGTLSTLVR